MPCSCGVCQECDWARNHEYEDDAIQSANERISELEAQLAVEKKKVADLEKPAAFGWQCYQDRCENAYIEQSVVRKMEAKLKAAREALEIARQETRIAAVMLDQVEPSAAITVKESDRLHLAANKMRTVSDLSDKALAALDGEVKA